MAHQATDRHLPRHSPPSTRLATPVPAPTPAVAPDSAEDLDWLESRSMLYRAAQLSDALSGSFLQWQRAFASPRPRDCIDVASVWFTSYPEAIVTPAAQSVLQTLGSPEFLATLRDVGLDGIHTGPMKRAGGLRGRTYTPTIDGLFDRIELSIDPLFGTNDEYVAMTHAARQLGIAVIADVVPAHTGKGADFRLAERFYKDYAGIYTMIEIPESEWELLGEVNDDQDCVNLSLGTAQILEDKGYIPGPTDVVPFYDPGVKETNWSATDVVRGVDGRDRRWVYLHVFKAGQPSLNWIDPSCGAQRIVLGDVVQSLVTFGDTGLRLDANPLLGIECRRGLDKAWVEGHPLAEGVSNHIAMTIRRLGGFSFQEINVSLEDLKRFTVWGPDLSYDFVTRPPYLYAMATGNAAPLRLMLRLMLAEGLDPGSFVHALQNHDELMFDLAHLRKHGDELFDLDGEVVTGAALYQRMYAETRERIIGSAVPEFSNLGFCTTMAAFAAAALGIPDLLAMTAAQVEAVRRLHLLAAGYNALQPGVFALSGWDLVGALPVPSDALGAWLADRDSRWMNRGAFDLMGVNPDAETSAVGIPKAACLYGTLPDQLRDPTSFVSRLAQMLTVRRVSGLAGFRLILVPEVDQRGVVVLLLAGPGDESWLLTALNFGREPWQGTVRVPPIAGKSARPIFALEADELTTMRVAQVSAVGDVVLALAPLDGALLAIDA
jgi:maltose alpha-D-glucosyltransferase/alpha-amylase